MRVVYKPLFWSKNRVLTTGYPQLGQRGPFGTRKVLNPRPMIWGLVQCFEKVLLLSNNL
jgi:hypothetical protein